MLSIKNSLCSALLLATYATAAKPGQSAINLSVEYCSDENTGSENDKGSNIYQTLGLCNDSCQGKFKYAVLQYQECWCSNEKPAKTADLEKCNQSCPGYPEQKCGNKGAGMYAYVPLDGAPFGDEPSTTSPSGPASTSSNSTVPAMTPSSSAGTNSTSSTGGSSGSAGGANGNGNSTSSSDDADAAFEGDANGLSVPRNTLAMGAVLGLLATCAFGITA